MKDDLISRQNAIDAHCELCGDRSRCNCDICPDMEVFQLLPPAQPETYKEKLNEIASALSEKFAYMNTCLNERDIILGYLGVKRCCETHCNTDCTNTKCESHPLSFSQAEHNPDDERKIADLHKMVNYLLSRLEQQWIPCSEETGDGYPEKDGFYYVTEQNYGFYLDAECKQRVTHTSHFKNGDFTDRFYTENISNITAWMPLPEPWKEGEME